MIVKRRRYELIHAENNITQIKMQVIAVKTIEVEFVSHQKLNGL